MQKESMIEILNKSPMNCSQQKEGRPSHYLLPRMISKCPKSNHQNLDKENGDDVVNVAGIKYILKPGAIKFDELRMIEYFGDLSD